MLNNLAPIRIEKVRAKGRNYFLSIEIYHCSVCSKELRVEKRRLKNHSGRCLNCINIKLNTDPIFNIFLSNYKTRAKRSNLLFDLTNEEFKLLINQNCTYCGEIPQVRKLKLGRKNKIYTFICNGIDRVDSSKGYVKENCVSCCKTCNFFKLDYTEKDFLNHIEKIYNFKIKENK